MAGLLDFIQGASNAAAGTVSGPVDLLSYGLRKAGVPLPAAPFGGSQWMRNVGLMREPQDRTAGLLGESLGNVLPIVAAAKAPQIAGGLLQMGENMRAPMPMNAATRGQAGAIVYHGSPHKFDKFDSSKIGTGEGAQAYGHGLYVAQSPGVAKQYQRQLAGIPDDEAARLIKQAGITPEHLGSVAGADDVLNFAWHMKDRIVKTGDSPKEAASWVFDNANWAKEPGNFYKIDLPDNAIAKMLDWDKPISQQPGAVQNAARDLGLPASATGKDIYNALANRARGKNAGATLGAAQAAASGDLLGLGVPGVRYLDGVSRAAGEGTSNYVVFPGNEGLLNILSRE